MALGRLNQDSGSRGESDECMEYAPQGKESFEDLQRGLTVTMEYDRTSVNGYEAVDA